MMNIHVSDWKNTINRAEGEGKARAEMGDPLVVTLNERFRKLINPTNTNRGRVWASERNEGRAKKGLALVATPRFIFQYKHNVIQCFVHDKPTWRPRGAARASQRRHDVCGAHNHSKADQFYPIVVNINKGEDIIVVNGMQRRFHRAEVNAGRVLAVAAIVVVACSP